MHPEHFLNISIFYWCYSSLKSQFFYGRTSLFSSHVQQQSITIEKYSSRRFCTSHFSTVHTLCHMSTHSFWDEHHSHWPLPSSMNSAKSYLQDALLSIRRDLPCGRHGRANNHTPETYRCTFFSIQAVQRDVLVVSLPQPFSIKITRHGPYTSTYVVKVGLRNDHQMVHLCPFHGYSCNDHSFFDFIQAVVPQTDDQPGLTSKLIPPTAGQRSLPFSCYINTISSQINSRSFLCPVDHL
jgi:hypothetical protein